MKLFLARLTSTDGAGDCGGKGANTIVSQNIMFFRIMAFVKKRSSCMQTTAQAKIRIVV